MSLSGFIESALSLNSFAPAATLRKPGGAILIDGIYFPWAIIETSHPNYGSAATYKVTIPMSQSPLPVSYFTSAPTITVEVRTSVFGGGYTSGLGFNLFDIGQIGQVFTGDMLDSLMVGEVDHVSYQPYQTLLTLSGRDLTARFQDNKTNEKFQNLTSSQIAETLAQRRGLKPVVTPTKIRVGKYYQIDHSRLTSQTTEWDLLTYLAKEEDYDVFVKGYSLYFQPKSLVETPYIVDLTQPFFTTTESVLQSNTVKIELSRNMKLAKDIIVNVKSFNVKSKQVFIKTASLKHSKDSSVASISSSSNQPEIYNYVFPNLTPEQTQIKANQLLQEISKHEMEVNISMPADNILTPQNLVKVVGTNSNYDQIYYVKNIDRTFNFNDGYEMRFEAKNQSPNVETQT